jgi:hypothetical protein
MIRTLLVPTLLLLTALPTSADVITLEKLAPLVDQVMSRQVTLLKAYLDKR